jgi:hypothetical protein
MTKWLYTYPWLAGYYTLWNLDMLSLTSKIYIKTSKDNWKDPCYEIEIGQ